MLDQQIPSDGWSQAFCIDTCLPLSPLLHLSTDLPLSDSSCLPLCVIYTLHFTCFSLFSIPFYLFQMPGKKSVLHFMPPHLPHLILSQGPGKWGREKGHVENGKWGLCSCSSPFSSPYMLLFCRKGKFVAHIWDEKRKKKNTAEEWEMVQSSREQRRRECQKVIFFFWRVVRPCRVKEKKGTRGETKNAEVSNLFISLKKVTVVYQLTIHSGFCISPDSLASASYSVFHSISLPPLISP